MELWGALYQSYRVPHSGIWGHPTAGLGSHSLLCLPELEDAAALQERLWGWGALGVWGILGGPEVLEVRGIFGVLGHPEVLGVWGVPGVIPHSVLRGAEAAPAWGQQAENVLWGEVWGQV